MIYYNEFDKGKAAWLRELMKRGAITPGDVDERSITDVSADDLRGYRRCHFFAGIGLWDRALIDAGWPEDREIWSASCPCQPFSTAGRRKGKADERHLWPVLARLIEARRPECVIGEQVASGDGLEWFDDVLSDLGDCGYTIGASITPACGYGAPHRRERLYWVAHSEITQRWRSSGAHNGRGRVAKVGGRGASLRAVGDADEAGSQGLRQRRDSADQCAIGASGVVGSTVELPTGDGRQQGWPESSGRGVASGCGVGGVEQSERSEWRPHADGSGGYLAGPDGQREATSGAGERGEVDGVEFADSKRRDREPLRLQPWRPQQEDTETSRRGPVNGYWRDAAWIYCKDGKYRAVESSYKYVADGPSSVVGSGRIEGRPRPEIEEEKVDGNPDQAGPAKDLSSMRKADDQKTDQPEIGGSGCVREASILQSEMHGEWDDPKSPQECFGESPKGPPTAKAELRDLRINQGASRSSYRPRSIEQRDDEFADFMSLLPHAGTLAELHGDSTTAEAVRTLFSSIGKEGALLDPQYSAAALWKSLTEEDKDWLRMAFDSGRWVRTYVHPLQEKGKARVLRLRGAGDAIVLPQAVEWVKAVMEVTK